MCLKTFFPPFNFDTIGDILIHWLLHHTLFCEPKESEPEMQVHAFTRTRFFYSLNVIISHPIVQTEGLGYLSICAIASRSSPPSHLCICNGHHSSELFCVHCTSDSTRRGSHTSEVWDAAGGIGGPERGAEAAGTQGPAQRGSNNWSLMDSRPGQYSIASSRP
jgi:hypothetical protein